MLCKPFPSGLFFQPTAAHDTQTERRDARAAHFNSFLCFTLSSHSTHTDGRTSQGHLSGKASTGSQRATRASIAFLDRDDMTDWREEGTGPIDRRVG